MGLGSCPRRGCRSRDRPGAGQVPSGLISQEEGGCRHPAASIPLLSREVHPQQPSSGEKPQCQAARCWVNILAAVFVPPSPSRTDRRKYVLGKQGFLVVQRWVSWDGGCLVQDWPPTMLNARLPACTSCSQPTDLCPAGDRGRHLSGKHPQTKPWGSSSSDAPVPSILPISPAPWAGAEVAGMSGAPVMAVTTGNPIPWLGWAAQPRLWAWCLERVWSWSPG